MSAPPLTAADVHRIRILLEGEYGDPRHGNPADPLDDLIFVVLSRMTQEVKYLRTYAALREKFPDWAAVADAPRESLESILADAGLARVKAEQIQLMLAEIRLRQRRDPPDLQHLHLLPDHEVEVYLTSLPGVGTKTARCVMLYALGRSKFPVDAHAWRIMRRIGLAENRPWSDARAKRLESKIPTEDRSSLHVTLISHGRRVCLARKPACDRCAIRSLCQRVGVSRE